MSCEKKLKEISSKGAENKTGYGQTPEELEKEHLMLQNRHALDTPVPGLIVPEDLRKHELQFVRKVNIKDAVRLLDILNDKEEIKWNSEGQLIIKSVPIDGSNFYKIFPMTFSGFRESK